MPSMTSTQYAVRIAALGKNMQKEQRKAVSSAALLVKRSVEKQTSIATKGSMGFSRMDQKLTRNKQLVKASSNSSKLRVGYDVKGTRKPTALLVARGPWGLIEYGSVPHTITPRLGRITGRGAARARRQRALNIAFSASGAYSGVAPLAPVAGGGRPVYRVNHPGTKGKKPFARGVDLARAQAARKARASLTAVVADTFKVNRNAITYIRGGGSTGFRVG